MRANAAPPGACRRGWIGLQADPQLQPVCDRGQTVFLRRLQAGERAAAERFVREHRVWMSVLARRYLRDPGLAEDCVQEAFLQAFRSIGRFEGRCALKSWLHRILTNAALMRLRSQRSGGEQAIEDMQALDGACCHTESIWRDVPTPHEMLERKQACELVSAKLGELPDSYRVVLYLRDIEGMTTEETARALSMTEGAVKVRLHRARAAFKMLVAPVLSGYV
jgi:RNA polymerase sigma-70 factor, ECF subfamily